MAHILRAWSAAGLKGNTSWSHFWIKKSIRLLPYIDRIKHGKFLHMCEFKLWEPQRLRRGSSVVRLLLWRQFFNFQIIYVVTVQVSVSSRQLSTWITVGIFLQYDVCFSAVVTGLLHLIFPEWNTFYQTYCWIRILFQQNISYGHKRVHNSATSITLVKTLSQSPFSCVGDYISQCCITVITPFPFSTLRTELLYT